MELAKFCSILEKSSLFFVKPEIFEDPWEGFLPRKHSEENNYENLPAETRATIVKSIKEDMPKFVRGSFAVNCWHISNHESEAFWKKYHERGIALQTTFGKLRDSFNVNKDYNIYIGEVDYLDENLDSISIPNLFSHILWKRKSFEYENELRAIIWEKENPEGRGSRGFDTSKGQYISTDLNLLIENIYTTPFEKDVWLNEIVNDLIAKYGFKFRAKKSSLMDKPF